MAHQVLAALCLLSFLSLSSHASPYRLPFSDIHMLARQDGPMFPSYPPSCPICAQNYANINTCAQAAPVFANWSQIVFDPGEWINVIKCACTDTFQSVYPQCVDCFIKTNQTQYLDPSDNGQQLPAIISGIRQICSMESSLLGGVPTADGEVTPTSAVYPYPTGFSSAMSLHQDIPFGAAVLVLALVAGS